MVATKRQPNLNHAWGCVRQRMATWPVRATGIVGVRTAQWPGGGMVDSNVAIDEQLRAISESQVHNGMLVGPAFPTVRDLSGTDVRTAFGSAG